MESNDMPEQSPERDFKKDLQMAQSTGDFDYVLDTARKSHKMLTDFRDAIRTAEFPGKETAAVAIGLNFLDNMIANASGQLNALKQAEKQTREALKKALKEKENGHPVGEVKGPENPPEVPPAAVEGSNG